MNTVLGLMLTIIERVLEKRHAVAGTFLRVGMLLIAFGYVSGYPVRVIARGVLLAAGVSMIALGLRYIEFHCQLRD